MNIHATLAEEIARNRHDEPDSVVVISTTTVPDGSVIVYKRLAARPDYTDEYHMIFHSKTRGYTTDMIAGDAR